MSDIPMPDEIQVTLTFKRAKPRESPRDRLADDLCPEGIDVFAYELFDIPEVSGPVEAERTAGRLKPIAIAEVRLPRGQWTSEDLSSGAVTETVVTLLRETIERDVYDAIRESLANQGSVS